MKIDSSRYRLFLTNPEEYRLRECWNIVPQGGGATSLSTFGRRRGTAFHELTEGASAEDLCHLGDTAVATAEMMHSANEEYGRDTVVLWREKEFDIPIPGSPHRMVGRVDTMVERYEETFILDFKTSKHRTKEDMRSHLDGLQQSPQVDFYLSAHPEVSKMVYRVLSKKPATSPKKPATIVISEIECRRQKWQLEAFQYGVHMVCTTIEFWKKEFGITRPWPRAVKLPISSELYGYNDLVYQRPIYPGMEDGLEGYTTRIEHLDCLKEAGPDEGREVSG